MKSLRGRTSYRKTLRLTDQSPVPRLLGPYQKISDSDLSEQGSKFMSGGNIKRDIPSRHYHKIRTGEVHLDYREKSWSNSFKNYFFKEQFIKSSLFFTCFCASSLVCAARPPATVRLKCFKLSSSTH